MVNFVTVPYGNVPWIYIDWALPLKKDLWPVELLWDGDGVPPEKDLGPEEEKVLWDGDGVPPPVNRHIPVKA